MDMPIFLYRTLVEVIVNPVMGDQRWVS